MPPFPSRPSQDAASGDGRTALLVAAEQQAGGSRVRRPGSDRLGVLRALVDAGADLEARRADGGETALMVALKARDGPTVQALLALGASVNARDARGDTVLDVAKGSGSSMEVLDSIEVLGGMTREELEEAGSDDGGGLPTVGGSRYRTM